MEQPANIYQICRSKLLLSIVGLSWLLLWSLHPGQSKSLYAENQYQDTRPIVQEAWFRYNASNKASSPQCKSLGGKLNDLIGKQDAAIIADPQGRIIFSKNADKNLIPASLLKILTALVALH